MTEHYWALLDRSGRCVGQLVSESADPPEAGDAPDVDWLTAREVGRQGDLQIEDIGPAGGPDWVIHQASVLIVDEAARLNAMTGAEIIAEVDRRIAAAINKGAL